MIVVGVAATKARRTRTLASAPKLQKSRQVTREDLGFDSSRVNFEENLGRGGGRINKKREKESVSIIEAIIPIPSWPNLPNNLCVFIT